MAEYIDKNALYNMFEDETFYEYADRDKIVLPIIKAFPVADVVGREVYEQTGWERDVAIEQLKSIGKSFGEKMDDVAPRRHGEWMKHYRSGVTVSDGFISSCCDMWNNRNSKFCPGCGALMNDKSNG